MVAVASPLREAWSRRLDALLDDGTSVHVVGIGDLRALKASVGPSKDIDDIAQRDAIARATLSDATRHESW